MKKFNFVFTSQFHMRSMPNSTQTTHVFKNRESANAGKAQLAFSS